MTKPKHITDAQLLAWIESGELVVRRVHKPRPQLYFRGRRIKATIVECNGQGRMPGNARYRWEICDGSRKTRRGRKRRKRTIVCAKLVWMYCNREVVPDTDHIHHGPGGRLDDSIDNLSRMFIDDHKNHHYGNGDLAGAFNGDAEF